jgi:hypothetical protein
MPQMAANARNVRFIADSREGWNERVDNPARLRDRPKLTPGPPFRGSRFGLPVREPDWGPEGYRLTC